MTTLLTLQNETLGWGETPVLTGVSLSVQQGERIALLGPSGVGKSTLLHTMFSRLADQRVALAPQEAGLVVQLSVFHNVWMGCLDDFSAPRNLRTLLWPSATERAKVEEVLSQTGLGGLGRRKVSALSGGQKQRVALSRALLRRGAVVIADEPVSSVDPAQARDLLRTVTQTFQTSVLALHDVALAQGYATRIIGLRAGKVAIDCAADALSQADIMSLYS